MKEIKITNGYDAAKWDLTDFYEDSLLVIKKELYKGKNNSFTTGWYSCKKEIQSGKIDLENGVITCYASVSDDFDTEATGQFKIPFTKDINKIQEALYKALDEAQNTQKEIAVYSGYSICDKSGRWVETYIECLDNSFNTPPGDNYHKWGFQGDIKLSSKDKKMIKNKILDGISSEIKVGNWVVKPWRG